MKEQAAYKRFENSLLFLARKYRLWDVFHDFLDFSLLFIKYWDRNPADYAELEKKYTSPEEYKLFTEAYMAMVEIADCNGVGFKDPFGYFYEEHLSNHFKGQFFTPEHVCDFMARILIDSEDAKETEHFADPCCGSGRLILSAGKINRKMKFFAADVDIICCKMTVLNCFLNTLTGEVAWMNSLTNDHWKSWHLKKILTDDGKYLPYYHETGAEPERFHVEYPISQTPEPGIEPETTSIKSKTKKQCKQQQSKNQLSLDLD